MTKAVELAQVASTGVSEAFKNRLINGGMTVDQRNNGASFSSSGNGVYSLDRWFNQNNSGGTRFSVQQNAGSVTPPAGFTNYLGVTSTSAYTVVNQDVIGIGQYIEGFNMADLNWGTANARTVTLSFWVRSSLTGTFGGSLNEANAGTAFYPYTYTISAANTWEYKTVTVVGPTIGTWQTTNSRGMGVLFNLGTGADYIGAAGAWSGSSFYAPTGAVSVVGTDGATFYITGVQLEVGSSATSFEYRPYGTELNLCRRYTQVYRSSTNGIIFPNGWYFDGNNIRFIVMFDQEMRAACAVSFFGTANTDYLVMDNASGVSGFTFGAEQLGARSCVIQANKTGHGITNKPNNNLYIATSNAGGFICSSEL
jgi:hypothetical protein